MSANASGRVGDADRAGGLRPEPAAQSRPIGAHPSRGRTQIVVTGRFTASHYCLEPELHSHRFNVTAHFETPARVDVRLYHIALQNLLASWDSKTLPENLQWNEDIAFAIGRLVNCVEVVVMRDDEPFGARWLA